MSLEKYNSTLIELTSNKKGPVSTPICNSASFGFGDSATGVERFSGDLDNPQYSRMGNYTNLKLEQAFCAIEGGVRSYYLSSGMAAVSLAVMTLCKAGDEVLVVGGLFGGTYSFFSSFCAKCGIKAHFFEADDYEKIEATINSKTKLLFCESVGNPNLKLTDIPRLAEITTRNGIALIVDNTVTPLSIKPIELGADIVVYSTTKVLTGNSSALGGVTIFRGLEEKNEKFLGERYKSIVEKFLEKYPKDALARSARPVMRDLGFVGNALASYLTLLGLETLALRLECIKRNVPIVAKGLQEAGLNIRHPSLPNHEHHALYKGLYDGYVGTLLTIDCADREEAFSLLDNCKRVTITANICDNRTLGLHMASTIYKDYDDEAKSFLGITKGLVRVSIGLEAPEDIIADFVQASKK